jgi:hypothetical protein
MHTTSKEQPMFYVVNKQPSHETGWLEPGESRDQTRQFESAATVAAHMLGRRMSQYFVVKSDAQGDRVVPWPSTDVFEIQQVLEQA